MKKGWGWGVRNEHFTSLPHIYFRWATLSTLNSQKSVAWACTWLKTGGALTFSGRGVEGEGR